MSQQQNKLDSDQTDKPASQAAPLQQAGAQQQSPAQINRKLYNNQMNKCSHPNCNHSSIQKEQMLVPPPATQRPTPPTPPHAPTLLAPPAISLRSRVQLGLLLTNQRDLNGCQVLDSDNASTPALITAPRNATVIAAGSAASDPPAHLPHTLVPPTSEYLAQGGKAGSSNNYPSSENARIDSSSQAPPNVPIPNSSPPRPERRENRNGSVGTVTSQSNGVQPPGFQSTASHHSTTVRPPMADKRPKRSKKQRTGSSTTPATPQSTANEYIPTGPEGILDLAMAIYQVREKPPSFAELNGPSKSAADRPRITPTQSKRQRLINNIKHRARVSKEVHGPAFMPVPSAALVYSARQAQITIAPSNVINQILSRLPKTTISNFYTYAPPALPSPGSGEAAADKAFLEAATLLNPGTVFQYPFPYNPSAAPSGSQSQAPVAPLTTVNQSQPPIPTPHTNIPRQPAPPRAPLPTNPAVAPAASVVMPAAFLAGRPPREVPTSHQGQLCATPILVDGVYAILCPPSATNGKVLFPLTCTPPSSAPFIPAHGSSDIGNSTPTPAPSATTVRLTWTAVNNGPSPSQGPSAQATSDQSHPTQAPSAQAPPSATLPNPQLAPNRTPLSTHEPPAQTSAEVVLTQASRAQAPPVQPSGSQPDRDTEDGREVKRQKRD
jgi:hypothetical protein